MMTRQTQKTAQVLLMLTVIILLVFAFADEADAGGSRRAVPGTIVDDSPKTPAPTPDSGIKCGIPGMPFVTLGSDIGPSVNRELAQKALCLINEAVASGCVREKIAAFKFATLERDPLPQLKRNDNMTAWSLYVERAPHAIDWRWYYKRFSKVVGYTYFYRDNVKGNPTETRIWSNTKYIGTDPKPLAGHAGHELAHNERAGGFGHWTRFDGSFPYTVGNAIEECVRSL